MFINVVRPSKRKRLLYRLMAMSLAGTMYFPAGIAFADEPDTDTEKSNVSIKSYLELEDLIFTAERMPTNRWDTPANVHVITAQEIEENHYHSVLEALRHVNGVTVPSGTSMNGTERVVMLIDGKRWADPQNQTNASKSIAYIPAMNMIERIEIIKGGNSALYGSDAFSGVVNVITKKGTKNETTVDLSGGSFKTRYFELSNQGVAGKFSWFLAGQLGKVSESVNKDIEHNAMPAYKNLKENGFSIRVDDSFTDRNSLTFGITHYYTSAEFDRFFMGQNQYDNGLSISYNFKEGTSTPSWLRYYYNESVFADYGTSNPKNKFHGIDYQNGWEIGQHKFIAGAEYHHSSASYPLHGYTDQKVVTTSGYIQDAISFGDKWKLVVGTRFDNSDEFGKHWSPKISANYRANDKTKFYASWGKSYNLPLISEMYSKIPSDSANISELVKAILQGRTIMYGGRIGRTPYLRPEKGYTYTAGFNHDFNDNTELGVNFFMSKINDTIDWYYIHDPIYDYYEQLPVNYVPLKTRGMEIDFRQKLNDHFSYNVGYSYTKKYFDGVVRIDEPYSQPNGYRLALTYRNRGFKANLLGVMANGIDDSSYPVKRYAVMDLKLNYDLNENVMLYFRAHNLTNQKYSDIKSLSENQHFFEVGRELIGGVTFRF